MNIHVNGSERDVPADTTVAGLIEILSLQPSEVAVERNGRIVRRAAHAETTLTEGDKVEIVTLVGGG